MLHVSHTITRPLTIKLPTSQTSKKAPPQTCRCLSWNSAEREILRLASVFVADFAVIDGVAIGAKRVVGVIEVIVGVNILLEHAGLDLGEVDRGEGYLHEFGLCRGGRGEDGKSKGKFHFSERVKWWGMGGNWGEGVNGGKGGGLERGGAKGRGGGVI